MYFATDSTWNQGAIFLVLLCMGMALGLVYTIIDGEKCNTNKKILKTTLDICFCIIMFLALISTLYMVADGKIYGYMVLPVGVGFVIGKRMFEKTVRKAINKANSFLKLLKKQLNKKAK